MVKRRNPIARSPIMRKGGAHVRTKSGERSINNRNLEDEVTAALEELQLAKKNRVTGKSGDSGYLLCTYLKEKRIHFSQ